MTGPPSHRVVDTLARERLFPFLVLVFEILHPGQPSLQRSWYLCAMCYWLERVESGILLRSMIWLQPRALKSIAVAVAFPCWLVGRDPTRQVMVATYSDSLGRTHAEHRRQIFESSMYRRLFPEVKFTKDGYRLLDQLTTVNGRIRSVSVEGTATGHGAHFIILDDCMKPEDARSDIQRQKIKSWYEGTISTRVMDEHAAIISIQQRIHEDDLPEFLRQKGYELLCLPARAPRDIDIEIGPSQVYHWRRNELLCPERFSEEYLAAKKIEHGLQHYSAQFLQDPVAPEGNLAHMEHFPRFEVEIRREDCDKVFQSWDTATSTLETADWSVCTTWGYLAGRLFLLHMFRKRVEYGALKAAVLALKHKWGADKVLIERSTAAGINLCQELTRVSGITPVPVKSTMSKVDRFIAQTGEIQDGRVWLPAQLPGLDEFLSELRAFPFGRYDDQVDTLSQILDYIKFRWREANTPCTKDGRKAYVNRDRVRPPLPPLPDWIY